MTAEPVLAIDEVSYAYAGTQVLDRVSLVVKPSQIVALFGRNGAGKSTLLRCAAGWSPPASGSIRVLGRDLRSAERELRRNLVLVPDTPSFYDDLTAREHIRFVLNANRLRERRDLAEDLLHRFGIWSVADHYPSTFSRGMQYKLGLVIALAVRPRVLLLDEPFGPIDAMSADVLSDALRAMAREHGCGILVASHQLPDPSLPTGYAVLDEGRVIAQSDKLEFPAAAGESTLGAILREALGRAEAASVE